jgi:acetyl-CoA carboxylase carboxyltransferase component
MDKKRLGKDPLEWIKDTREDPEGKRQEGKAGRRQGVKTPREKITLYLDRDTKKRLKHLGVDTGRELSDLTNEALEILLNQWGEIHPEKGKG